MGCDIHCCTEIKVEGKWHLYGQPRIDRNYEFFGYLAGVRSSDFDPIAKNRGLPRDASVVTKLEFAHWGSDAHSVSWLSGKEMDQATDWYRKKYKEPWHDIFDYLRGNNWDKDKYPDEFPTDIEDARVIFWFDN